MTKAKEIQLQDNIKKLQKTLRFVVFPININFMFFARQLNTIYFIYFCKYRELREQIQISANRENDFFNKLKEKDKKLDTTEVELTSVRNDLRLALQRISDLQQAMEDGDEDSTER